MKKKFIIYIAIMVLLGFAAVGIGKIFAYGGLHSKTNPEARAKELLADMTLEEKVGQMFMGCFYSKAPSAETVRNHELGGVLLFSSSFKNTSPEVMTAKLATLDGVCNIAPMVAVDEEGGDVVRVSASKYYRSKPFSSPRDLYKSGGMDAVVSELHEKNLLLKRIGIDMNLAPVCDISTDPDDFMYSRSLGQSPEITADFAARTAAVCAEDNIGCSLKHFPGYGNAVDTHIGSAIDKRSLEQIMEQDILPFRSGIDAGAPSVLVSHNTVVSIDASHPASLSPAVIDLLRSDLGFNGVIITDDLIMGAVTEYGSKGEIAIAAVMAGNDMLCTGDFVSQIPAVVNAVNEGIITEDQIDASVLRILMMKLKLGIIS